MTARGGVCWLALCGLLLARMTLAAPAAQELEWVAALPVAEMRGGNLSGVTRCPDGRFWAVSDREDARLYQLIPHEKSWRAEAHALHLPAPPQDELPFWLRWLNALLGMVRGDALDFEGISCDAAGNRYVLSEANVAVAKVLPSGEAAWLPLPREAIRQARERGLLRSLNALAEGVAVDPSGQRVWLAAERDGRGLLAHTHTADGWHCAETGCVLLAEAQQDFSDVAFFDGYLYSLERQARQVCQCEPDSGNVRRCWSLAAGLGRPELRYDTEHELAEALFLDADGLWIGIDNGSSPLTARGRPNASGEARPMIFYFKAPPEGWGG